MILKNKSIFKLFKIIFEIGILIFFIGGYLQIIYSLQSNIFVKFVFSILYIWFTIGMNVNLIIPLLKLIDNKIKNL